MNIDVPTKDISVSKVNFHSSVEINLSMNHSYLSLPWDLSHFEELFFLLS